MNVEDLQQMVDETTPLEGIRSIIGLAYLKGQQSKDESAVEIYRGWIGHFICADRCMFRLNTLIIVGEARVVVSTVGNMIVDGKQETIGAGYYYETMAFYAKYTDGYWDADVSMALPLHGKHSVDHIDRYSDNEAQVMHERVVSEVEERMKNGDIK